MSLRSWLPSQQNSLRPKHPSTRRKQATPGHQHPSRTPSIPVEIAIHINMANIINDDMESSVDDINALATDLIALLDRFIFLEGCTLNAHPIRPESILRLSLPTTPPSPSKCTLRNPYPITSTPTTANSKKSSSSPPASQPSSVSNLCSKPPTQS